MILSVSRLPRWSRQVRMEGSIAFQPTNIANIHEPQNTINNYMLVRVTQFEQEILKGKVSVPLTSCLTGLDQSVLQIKTKIVTCHTADSKPVKQEGNSTVILPPLVFPGLSYQPYHFPKKYQYLILITTSWVYPALPGSLY